MDRQIHRQLISNRDRYIDRQLLSNSSAFNNPWLSYLDKYSSVTNSGLSSNALHKINDIRIGIIGIDLKVVVEVVK